MIRRDFLKSVTAACGICLLKPTELITELPAEEVNPCRFGYWQDFPLNKIVGPRHSFRIDCSLKRWPHYDTLKQSMKRSGCLNTIHVVWTSKECCWAEIINGLFRVHVARDLGWKTIPAVVSAPMTEHQVQRVRTLAATSI